MNVDLVPREEYTETFRDVGEVRYQVRSIDGSGHALQGTVTVGNRSSGILVVLIHESSLEPSDILVGVGDSLTWKNNQDSSVRLSYSPVV